MKGKYSKIFVANLMCPQFGPASTFSEATTKLGRHVLTFMLPIILLFLGGCTLYQDPALDITGGCAPSSSPFLPPNNTVKGRITYCEGGDNWNGVNESRSYPPGTRDVEIMLSGYPGNNGVNLTAISSTGKTVRIPVEPQPREHWQRFMVNIPWEIAQTGYRLRIDDQSHSSFGWAGIGASISRPAIGFSESMLPMLVAVLLGNAWLIALSLCMPITRYPRDRLLVGLLVSGCVWFLIFIGYVLSAKLGSALAFLLLILPFPLGVTLGWRRRTLLTEIGSMQNVLTPVLTLTCLVLWIGIFPFHWHGQPNGDPAMRWPRLSTDAWLPLLFGDMLAHGRLEIPMVGDWLSSDRPPLQVGLYLMVRGVLPHARELVYQGISSWAQALALLPLAALLDRFMSKRAQAIALFTLSLSSLMLINTLFVWPKLLAGTFSIIYYMALFQEDGARKRWVQAGVAGALALLSHGGSLFFLVGASLMHLAWYRHKSLATLIRAGSLAFAFYLPWVAYQWLVDPPGNRLIKWQFAGKIPVSNESATHAIISAYSHLTPATWFSYRIENLAVVFKGALSVPHDAWRVITGQDPNKLSRFIGDDFFYLFHSMWFASPLLLPPCLALMYWRARRDYKTDIVLKDLLQIVVTVVVTTLVWVSAIFKGGETTIHIGAYASVLLLQLSVLTAVWRTNVTLFYAVCAANISVALSAYVFDRNFLPGFQSIYLLGTLLLCGGLLIAALTSIGNLRRPCIERPTNATPS